MEVDMHRHADDDLIDFDTDMNDEHDPSSQHNNHPGQYSVEVSTHVDEIDIDVENMESHEYQEGDAEMSDDADLVNIEETMQDADHIIEEVDETVYHEHLVAEEHTDVPVGNTETSGDDQGEVSHDLETSDPHSHSIDQAAKKGDESDNEIDYEIGEEADQSLEHASCDEADPGAEKGPVPIEVPTPRLTHDTQTDGSDALGKELNAEAEDSNKEQDGQNVIDEEAEITYEEDDHVAEGTLAHDVEHDAELAPIGSAEGVVEEEEEDEIGQGHLESGVRGENEEKKEEGEGEYPHDEATVHTPTPDEGVDHAEYDEYGVGIEVAEESTEQQAHVPEHTHSPSGHDSIVAESEFPAILVLYRGQSFPMFSHEDGFFSDVSLLDETVDKLLSAFRGELSNELSEQDEIALHVDELELRFSEVRNLEEPLRLLLTNSSLLRLIFLPASLCVRFLKSLICWSRTKTRTHHRRSSFMSSLSSVQPSDWNSSSKALLKEKASGKLGACSWSKLQRLDMSTLMLTLPMTASTRFPMRMTALTQRRSAKRKSNLTANTMTMKSTLKTPPRTM